MGCGSLYAETRRHVACGSVKPGQVPGGGKCNHQQEDTKMRFRIAVAAALLFASGLAPVSSFGQPTDDNPSVTANWRRPNHSWQRLRRMPSRCSPTAW